MSLFEKYRPKKLDEVIGQPQAVDILRKVPPGTNILMYGPPGCGKTSAAYAWARENGYEIINEFNASVDRGIDIIRNRINKLAFTKVRRVILLDEADMMTADAQHALRRPMEQKYREVTFILTCNYPTRIIDPIKSRCVNVPFKRLANKDLAKILLNILKKEKVKITDKKEAIKVLSNLAGVVGGDARMAINYLEPMIREGVFKPARLFVDAKPIPTVEVLKLAMNGEIREAIRKMEDILVDYNLSEAVIFRELYRAIDILDADGISKSLLYHGLSEAERGVKMGGNLLIQLAGFLGKVQLYNIVSHEYEKGLQPPPQVERGEEEGEIEF